MRTRFLNSNFSISRVSPDETLSFLNLPIPLLPLPRLPDFEPNLFSFDSIPNVSPEIAKLPIDSARCKFVAEVLPQKVDVDDRYFLDHPSRNSDICRPSRGSNEIWFSEAMQLLEDNESSTEDKQTHRLEVTQFEVPELDTFLENNSYPEENMKILSEVPEIENDPDSLRPDLKMQYIVEVQKSVYATDCTAVEYDMDVKACLLEEDDTDHDKIKLHQSPFPLLEVDETSLRNFSNPCMEDELLLSFEDISSKDNLLIDEMELLGSVQYNVLEFLGDHCLSKQHLEYDPSAADLGMDIINLVERKELENRSSPLCSLVFHDFEFLELDASGVYCSFFAMQKTDEPEACDWMFRDNENFKSFNELIVSCELALVDDTFKSMPVPILSDDNKIKSAYAVVGEMMANIKPEPLSASHSIYLEWHLLEEDQCNSKAFSFYMTALEGSNPLMIDFDWESYNKGKELLDIISSDDDFHGPKVEECKVSIDVVSRDNFSGGLNRGAPSKLCDEKCQNSANGEQLTQAKTVEASALFKSMSQFNDLEFFLNPGKATRGGKGEDAVELPSNNTTFPKLLSQERGPHSIPAKHLDMDGQKLKDAFNFLPTENNHNVRTSEAADVERCYEPIQVPCEMKFQQTQSCMTSSLNIIVAVNIHNLEKEMIVSRRSTYQKILVLEKEGLQVVERDLDLPVDIVISPSTCLVWYDCKNIRKKATGFDEASSCLALCIENIATDVLASLSYCFSCCILIFEGDTDFLFTVMECSDGLYGAAASLQIDLQIFCSYSPELTDEIILNSIFYEAKFCSGKYPQMTESETLAESFLTKFPSINPLTAHAILSSGGRLIQFFECSKEQRILQVQTCRVPEESISLFSALCSYGEREDSKSVTTDCSSSFSDTNKGNFNVSSDNKPKRCISGPEIVDIQLDSLWNSGPLSQFPDNWKPTDGERLDDFGSPLEDLIGQKQTWDIPMPVDSSSVSKSCNFSDCKDNTLVLDGVKRRRVYSNDEWSDQQEISAMNTQKKMNFAKNTKSDHLRQEIFGEVIDLTSCVDKEKEDSMYTSNWLPEAGEDSTRKSKAARRLSFGQNHRLIFPTVDEIERGSDLWSSAADVSHSLQVNKSSYSDSDLPLKHSKRPLYDLLRQECGGNSEKSPFKDEMVHCGRTPLSKAIRSTHSQPGSPWTVEFLNRIKEKSRLRQQSLPPDAPHSDFVYSSKKTKVTKRSPSILEFFKYKGGSDPEKMLKEKKQRQPKRLSKSKNVTTLPFLPTWTPADKRSRQILSFATSDSGGQTRLVWSDGTGRHPIKKLRNQ